MTNDEKPSPSAPAPVNPSMAECERCLKPRNLCVCQALPSLGTRLHVLILQHPQEPDKLLGTARLAHLCLPNSTLKIGLSWPNLRAALGKETDPTRWAVLYLGSGAQKDARRAHGAIQFVTKNAVPLDEAAQWELSKSLEGIVVLDGTWSQAKALWWRNPWLLKLRRAILNPTSASLYGDLRREPRRECLSTIETVAETLSAVGEPPETAAALKSVLGNLLQAYRSNYSTKKPRTDWRRRRRP